REQLMRSGRQVRQRRAAAAVRADGLPRARSQELTRNTVSYSLMADCRLEYLGDRGGGVIVSAAGPPQSRIERRHAAVIRDGTFCPVTHKILDHGGPAPLPRAE